MIPALLAIVLLLGQEESEYPRLLQQVRDAVGGFMEPEDGVLNSQPRYWDEVLETIDKVLNFQPTREIEAAYQMASAMRHFVVGDVQSALSDFQFGLSVDPNRTPMFHLGLGLCYSAMGKYSESEKELKLAAEGAPSLARPRSMLAALYMEAGRYKEAEAALRESIDLTAGDRARARQHLLLAQLQELQGDSQVVGATLRKAIELNSEDPLLPDYLGLHVFKNAGRDQALAIWKPALEAFAGNAALTREVSIVEKGIQVGVWRNTFTRSVKSNLAATHPTLPGGSRYRAFRFQAQAGDVLQFRTDSRSFQPFTALFSANGKAVALHDVRSSHFSLIEYRVTTAGAYYLIVSSYFPGQTGEFSVTRLK